MRHIVAISGGKDSTALALSLAERNPDTPYEYICTPTGNEPPDVFEHLNTIEKLLGRPLSYLAPIMVGTKCTGWRRLSPSEYTENRLFDLIDRHKMLPNFRARWCTRQLKIEPTVFYLQEASPCTQYVGLRADEAGRTGIYGDMEGVTQSYPFQDWGWNLPEVVEYLDKRNVTVPVRTDCAVCYHQRLVEWWRLWKTHPDLYTAGEDIEHRHEHTFRSPGRDTWPLYMSELRESFESGRLPQGARKYLQRTLINCDMDISCRVCSL